MQRKNIQRITWSMGLLILLSYSIQGVAMSLLFGTEVVLFSPLEGTITYQGKPANKAKIVRVLKWKDDVGEKETFYTDENGKFHLPIRKEKVRIPPLAEFVMFSELFVTYAGEEVQIWGRSKRGTDLYSELGGKPLNFHCELTDEVSYLDVEGGILGTSCKWDSLEK